MKRKRYPGLLKHELLAFKIQLFYYYYFMMLKQENQLKDILC